MFWKKISPLLLQSRFCHILNIIYEKSDKTAKWLATHGVTANKLTFIGLCFALLGLNFLALEHYFMAFLCLIANRICDILDGQIAREKGITAFGAFFDIFADYVSSAIFLWGFVLASPQNNASAGAFGLAMLTISASSLLGYSVVSGMNYKQLNQTDKKICAWGALQNSDHFMALLCMCVLPKYFTIFAIIFGLAAMGKTLLLVSGAYYTLEIAKKGKLKK